MTCSTSNGVVATTPLTLVFVVVRIALLNSLALEITTLVGLWKRKDTHKQNTSMDQ